LFEKKKKHQINNKEEADIHTSEERALSSIKLPKRPFATAQNFVKLVKNIGRKNRDTLYIYL